MSKVKQGTEITWKSQVRGVWRTKTGTVKRFLEAGDDAREYIGKTMPSLLHTRHPDADLERYLVKAEDSKGRTCYFVPRASTIEGAIAEEAAKAEKKAQREAKKAVAEVKTPAKKASGKKAGAAKVTAVKASKPEPKKSKSESSEVVTDLSGVGDDSVELGA